MSLSVEDKIALLEIPGRYGDALDDKNWDALNEIFTEDATYDIPVMDAHMEGLAEIKKFMSESQRQHPGAHLMANVYSLETAAGVELRSRVLLPRNEKQRDGSVTVLHGSYYDKVVKTAHGWRICAREFHLERRGSGR